MRRLWLCLIFGAAVPAVAASAAAKEAEDVKASSGPAASAGTIKLVEHFIKVPTAQLPADRVPDFIAVDPDTLPKKLRKPFLSKKEELMALKRVADGNKKPTTLRRLGAEGQAQCEEPMKGAEAAGILKTAGYSEITEDETAQLLRDTKCSVCELETEFTLKIVAIPRPPGKAKPKGKQAEGGDSKPSVDKRYFLHQMDPLNALVAGYRGGRKAFGTNFFGIGNPSCR